MKVATYQYNGQRHVGIVDVASGTVSPLDLSADEAQRGALSLIGRPSLPATGTAVALDDVRLEAPVPRPARNILDSPLASRCAWPAATPACRT